MPLDINENLDLLFKKLEDFLKSKTVIGDPITVGDSTLIPIINVSFGLGSGSGDGVGEKGIKGVGGGAGLGARISPSAILLISGGKTELIPITKLSGLQKLVEMVPDIVSKFNGQKEQKEDDKKE